MAQRVTLNNITKAVRALGYKRVKLYRGNSYYYWSGGIAGEFIVSPIVQIHM